MTTREGELYARLYPRAEGRGVHAMRDTLVGLGAADAAAALFDDGGPATKLDERCASLTSVPGMVVVQYAGAAHRRHDHGPCVPGRKYVYSVGARGDDGVHALTLMETLDGDVYTRWSLAGDIARACIFVAAILAVVAAVGFTVGFHAGTGALAELAARAPELASRAACVAVGATYEILGAALPILVVALEILSAALDILVAALEIPGAALDFIYKI